MLDLLRGGGAASLRRSGGNTSGGESRCPRWGSRGPPLGSVGSNKIRRQTHRQRSVLFCGPTREGWGYWVRTNGMPQDGMATTTSPPEMLPVCPHVDDVLITKLAVRLEISKRMLSKGGGDERWGSKPNKYEVDKATNMICIPSFE